MSFDAVRRWLVPLAFGVTICLGGCAYLSPDNGVGRQQSLELAAQQQEHVVSLAHQAKGRRVWLAGFAMNSTSPAFQGDLELVSSRLSDLGGTVLKYEHSNEPRMKTLRYPFANPQTLHGSLQHITEHARADDIVVLFISSHGNRRALSVNAAQKDYDPLTAARLFAELAPLGDRPTVVILSACFAGSFIPALQRDTHIVLTAASADRASFGCAVHDRNTFFIEELLANDFDASRSLVQLMSHAKSRIELREDRLSIPHSEPQLSVGHRVQWLADLPLRDWFRSAGPPSAAVDPLALLDKRGMDAFRLFLEKPYPRAFAVAPDGGWGFASGRSRSDSTPPVERAVSNCKKEGRAGCKLYAVDDRIVWAEHEQNAIE